MEIPGLAESRNDGPRVGGVEEVAVCAGGWMDGPCLMDDQVSRQHHSLDTHTHTPSHPLPPLLLAPVTSPTLPTASSDGLYTPRFSVAMHVLNVLNISFVDMFFLLCNVPLTLFSVTHFCK